MPGRGPIPNQINPPQQMGQPLYNTPPQAHSANIENVRKRTSTSLMGASSRASATYPRKRALTACDTCRLKKIKCDNVRPRCGSCVKNGNMNCHYRTDDQQKDYSSYDPASLNILTKLDVILRDLRDLKNVNGLESSTPEELGPGSGPGPGSGTTASGSGSGSASKRRQYGSEHREFHFDNCIWDMSITSILRWKYFIKCFGDTPEETDRVSNSLIKMYNRSIVAVNRNGTLESRLLRTKSLEGLLSKNFSNIVNSFFVNCHSKIPILDTLELFESLEIYKCLTSHYKSFSFIQILESYDSENPESDQLPRVVLDALRANNLEDTPFRRRAFKTLCLSVPNIIVICALGVVSTPVQLENLTKFDSSIEERKSIAIGCLSDSSAFNGVQDVRRDRLEISILLIRYAELLRTAFPFTVDQSSLRAVEFHLLLNQYYLYTMTPLLAYRHISTACQHMMYYINMRRGDPINTDNALGASKKEMIDRLFWSCLKLECELRVELSPYVPVSGITQQVPPTSFPKIPDPLSDEIKSNHSEACIKLANKYEDEYSWYYFLTEIAVRKVDNKMFDEIYSYESRLRNLWDQDSFANESAWIIFIKYLNQYNGIINSLSPQIRNFVLQEINVDQIHRRMKKKYEKKQSNISSDADVFDTLDDFLIDDDLLIRAQSESIMFIKTRIITSKLLLFRPIIYLLLEDKIPITELMEAAISVMGAQANITSVSMNNLNAMESPDSAGSVPNSFSGETNPSDADLEMDYFNLINAPLFYQRQYPDEDFSNVIEYTNKDKSDKDEDFDDENSFCLKSLPLARSRILRIFLQNLISLPKMNIPKLGAHRHPGSWYYLRNLFIGNVFQFLLYNKLQEMLQVATADEGMRAFLSQVPEISSMNDVMDMFNVVINKNDIIAGFEHSLILFDYWKEEMSDCEIYSDYIKRCIEKLEQGTKN
ncbi:Fungal transcriptional regulatory protein [Scheffersomyces stipitis CBS 6054]|uniref:Fungal transcriptional regulatory protein n=1 Tax=Scheffersomyces stipitis (strain ATCC 58785 / CBS 6054 / NBRC 10063 / NRRL Y-11545) TaxID=322104 RepID=A3GGC3_PICST|nr:Fungal transcriptional regulatory protein [Scheffersomyces stipitis CBS 6054]EAZ63908.2 Fungal transcriptional regulatory protein [Scheffersomyces stipitis CBS 6054]